jgi:hypothetical protein
MASVRAIAIRKQNAIERLKLISEEMALRAGIDPPTVGKRQQDPELARVQDLEAIADFLEAFARNSKPKKLKKEAVNDGEKES